MIYSVNIECYVFTVVINSEKESGMAEHDMQCEY
jgi:hypothetical protein